MKTYIYPYSVFQNRFAFRWIAIALFFMIYTYDYVQANFGFSFTDEILLLLLFVFWMGRAKHKGKSLKIVLAVFLGFLINSFLNPHNVTPAILSDFIQQLKPFVAFYCMYDLGCCVDSRNCKRICGLCLCFALIMLPIGILGAGGGKIMVDYFGGHARYSSIAICIGTTYYFFSNRSRKSLFVCFMIYGIGLLSMRSKMFGFFAAAIIINMCWHVKNMKSVKIMSLKSISMLIILVISILYAAKEKIFFYFVDGVQSENMFARPLLYKTAVEILSDFPLFGTGFGSYATDASAVYYSPLYYEYGLYLSPEIGNGLFISDTWFPALAQFGCVGICLFVLFWREVYIKAQTKYRLTGNSQNFKMALLIMTYFFIESVADSTFTQNRGMYMM